MPDSTGSESLGSGRALSADSGHGRGIIATAMSEQNAVVEHTTKWAEMWESWEVDSKQVIDAGGEQVIAFIRERGRTKAGLEVNERHSELYTVRNGKIAQRKGFSDADEALTVAGLL
jgi:ketosteroid isomerase-like protein